MDRIAYSLPVGPSEEFGRRITSEIQDLDREIILGMEAAGFKTWTGQRKTGPQTLGYTKGGGFYFDAGACKHVIDGSIKVEQGWIDQYVSIPQVYAFESDPCLASLRIRLCLMVTERKSMIS